MTALALSQELQRLRTENLILREALGDISRMRTLPDHWATAFRGPDAHEVAAQALARCDVATENATASESVI